MVGLTQHTSLVDAVDQPLKSMSLLLAIETSSNKYSVVIGQDGKSVYDSSQNDGGASSLRTIAELLWYGLDVIGLPVTEIAGVAINVGPGSLTYVRAGISFVNAMAFSLA
jgi:tRNA threonylcarbamoyladenosine biosynthesis protein TsaB